MPRSTTTTTQSRASTGPIADEATRAANESTGPIAAATESTGLVGMSETMGLTESESLGPIATETPRRCRRSA